MTSKNGVSFHLPKQLRRAAAGAEQQGATSRRDTLRRWKKAGASRPGFQRYSQRAKQWDSQKCSARQAPPRFAPVHPSSRVSRSGRVSLKLGQNSQDYSLHRCMFVAPYRARWGIAVAVLPYRTVPVYTPYATTNRSIMTVMYQHKTPHAQGTAEIQEPTPKLEINCFFPSIKSEDLASQEYHRRASFSFAVYLHRLYEVLTRKSWNNAGVCTTVRRARAKLPNIGRVAPATVQSPRVPTARNGRSAQRTGHIMQVKRRRGIKPL